MPRIPDDYLGKLSQKFKELKNSKKAILTTLMGMVIFIVCILESLSFFLPDYVGAVMYREFYYPLLTTIELFVFASFFVFKAFRHTSCLDTKIVSILLCFTFFISIIAILFQFCPQNYLLLVQPFILMVILLITLISGIKWFLK